MTYYDQWKEVDLQPCLEPIDHGAFSGLMKYPSYIGYLHSELLHPMVFIEITSKCNFFCGYCQSPTSIRPKGFMEEDLFRHIAAQLPDITNRPVALHIDGEPTLHPKFEHYVRILNSHGIRVSLASNGSTLQSSFHALDMDVCTYMSTSKEEFEARSSIDFERFNSRAMKYLSEWYVNDSKQNLVLKIYCPSEDANRPEVLRDKYDWIAGLVEQAGLPIQAIEYGALNFLTVVKPNGHKVSLSFSPIVAGGLFPESELYPGPKFNHADATEGFCDSAWSRMTIFCDGSIGLCCHGLQGETIYTRPEEIYEKSLRYLWLEHPYVKAFRHNMERKRLILDGCKQCLSRYPRREFYVTDGTFVPDVELNLGEELNFQENGNKALISGFATKVDGDGNLWTLANRPRFGFRVVTPNQMLLPESMLIEINAIAFAPKELGDNQHVDVIVNGTTIGRWKLSHGKPEVYRAVFPSNLLRDRAMMVALRFTERRSPYELKIGPDRRKLGMGISRIAVSAP